MFTPQNFQSMEEANKFVDEKSAELSSKMSTKVTPFFFVECEEPLDIAYGFFRNPSRTLKIQALDMASQQGPLTAGELLLKGCLIKEESDPRIGSDDPNYDAINIGAIGASYKVISVHSDQKKTIK